MPPFLSDFLLVLTALFVVVDPIPVAPMFASMTAERPAADVRRIARRASIAGAGLLLFFMTFGGTLFRALRLDINAFRAAGGLLLLLTALDMLRGKNSDCRCSRKEFDEASSKEDVSIVPLATPLLAGPGAIVTVMVLASERPGFLGTLPIVLTIALVFAVTYYTLLAGQLVKRVLGVSGMALLHRIMGLLLAAMSFQFIADGGRRLMGLG
jgi:multiple antibiotic resistance protein